MVIRRIGIGIVLEIIVTARDHSREAMQQTRAPGAANLVVNLNFIYCTVWPPVQGVFTFLLFLLDRHRLVKSRRRPLIPEMIQQVARRPMPITLPAGSQEVVPHISSSR